MNTQTVPALDYVKTFGLDADANGNKELVITYGPDESITYTMRIRVNSDDELLSKLESNIGPIELGQALRVAVEEVDDKPANIGHTLYTKWNKEKAAKATIATPLGTFYFTLRPHDKSELAELLKPTRKEKGFKAWLRRLIS